MSKARYPAASYKGDGKSGGTWTDNGEPKVVWHTTEGRNLPSYGGGKSAPHVTYLPGPRTWVQHTDATHAARALRNESGGVQTNRDNAIQVEIVAYSDHGLADSVNGLRIGNLSDDNYADLAAFAQWANKEHGVPYTTPGRQALSYSQANSPGFRLTGSQWDAYSGHVGHQHVPENSHWDPGALDIIRIITLAKGSPPMPTPKIYTLAQYKKMAPHMLASQTALKKGGHYDGELDAWWGPGSDKSVDGVIAEVGKVSAQLQAADAKAAKALADLAKLQTTNDAMARDLLECKRIRDDAEATTEAQTARANSLAAELVAESAKTTSALQERDTARTEAAAEATRADQLAGLLTASEQALTVCRDSAAANERAVVELKQCRQELSAALQTNAANEIKATRHDQVKAALTDLLAPETV